MQDNELYAGFKDKKQLEALKHLSMDMGKRGVDIMRQFTDKGVDISSAQTQAQKNKQKSGVTLLEMLLKTS